MVLIALLEALIALALIGLYFVDVKGREALQECFSEPLFYGLS